MAQNPLSKFMNVSRIERIEIQQWIADNVGISFAAHLEIKNKRDKLVWFQVFLEEVYSGEEKSIIRETKYMSDIEK